ncbi:MAG: MarR family transcriptional regulator [Carboxydocellales bacterium]
MDTLTDYAEETKNLLRCIDKNFRNYILAQIGKHKLGKYNLTVPQLMVMQELYSHPNITLTELSELMGLVKSTVSGIVDRLEIQGTVVRVRDVEDRRTVKISLAPGVTEVKDAINGIKKNYLTELLGKVKTDEVKQIVDGLKMLNLLMEEKIKERC